MILIFNTNSMATLTVNIDGRVKKRAQKMARRDGITLTFAVTQLLQAYVEGEFTFGLVPNKDHEYKKLSKKLTKLARRKIDVRNLPSLEKQLCD